MTVYDLSLFVAAGFAASLIAGIAGFAFGLVAASIWLYFLTPLQTTTLIAVFGLVVQGYSVWKLRGALRLDRLWPFLLGGIVGVPFGVELLRWADPHNVRQAVGGLLIAFTVYSLASPASRAAAGAGRIVDGGVGVLSGVVGGLTGLAGIVPTAWCSVRGWPKDEQRAVFQPVGVTIFLVTIAWLGGSGSIAADTAWLVALGLPAVLLGVWLGMKVYGRLSEGGFRKIVLALLGLSGVALLIQ
jgi:uncharacterized membrane protein YfcA